MKTIKSIPYILILGLVMGFAILATSQPASAQNPKPKNAKEKKHDDDDDDGDESSEHHSELARKAKVSKEQAQTTALAHVPGEVIESDIEKEDGKLIWSFDIRNSEGQVYDVEIDAMTGAVLKAEPDDEDDNDGEDDDSSHDQAALVKQAKITKEQATKTALARVPGEVIESEIEMEDGKLIWSFDIRNSEGQVFDVEIDAISGKVLKAAPDDEDDEDNYGDVEGDTSLAKNILEKAGTGITAFTAQLVGFLFSK